MKRKNEHGIEHLLKEAGVRFTSLSEVSLATIRNVQRGAFPDMRMIDLAPASCAAALHQPILKGTPHIYGADPDFPWSNYWVHFQGRQGSAFASLIGGTPVTHLQRNEEVVACIEQLYQYMSNVHARSGLIAASGALSQLLCLIQFRMGTTEPKGQTAEEGIERSINFMHKNLAKSLRLRDLAKIAGMSPGHYGMLFRKSREHTPVDYFNRLRIPKSCELLKTTDRPVGQIGESIGFTDPYYFSRLFKKVMGVSPRQYR